MKHFIINRILLVVFFSTVFFSNELFAQKNCNCKEAEQKDNLESLKKSNNNICIGKYHELIAGNYIKQLNYDSANWHLEKALYYYSKEKCDDNIKVKCFKLLANLKNSAGDYSKSLDYSLKRLSIVEGGSNKFDEADCLVTIALTFNRMKQSQKGIEYARKALVLANKMPADGDKGEVLYKIAGRYLWYYQDTKDMAILDTAEMITDQQLQLSKAIGDSNLIRRGFNHKNGYAHERKNYPAALRYLDSSFAYLKKVGVENLQATNYGDRADVLMEMGNYKEARRFADSCLKLHQITKNPETIANAYALIYQIGERSENYKDALWALNNYIEIHDSLTKVDRTKAINELEKKYNQAKNEKTIKELDQQKRIYLLLALTGLLAIVAIAFFVRQQSLKHKQKVMETEQRLNRARMNPHFFFNALTSLQSFALRENDGKAIASNLSKFSHIMRETLESSYKEYVTIEQEIDFLNEYLSLQQIRFPEKFSYLVKAEESLAINELAIPSMIIQPFVENSIEHGFANLNYKGNVEIHFSQKGEEIEIIVSDNGKGLSNLIKGNNNSGNDSNEHISRASQIIKDRIYLLNIKLKTTARFSIDNDPSGKGVVVKINLPVIPI